VGQYNPNSPLVVGNEYAPVLYSPYTPDLFAERGYSFKGDRINLYAQASMFVDSLPGWSVPGHAYLLTLYRRGQETNTGPMRTVTVPFSYVSGLNTASGGGAPSASPSVANPTDGWYTRLRSSSAGESYIRFRTSSTPAFLAQPAVLQGKRIVDVSILYTASAEPGNTEPVPLQINHFYAVTSARVSYGTGEVDLAESLTTQIRRSRWGEICTWTHAAAIDPFTEDISRYPWNYNLLTLFQTGTDFLIEFRTEAIAQDAPREIYLHYAAMQITYCEENRVGSWGVVLGADYDLTADPASLAAGGYRLGRNTQGPTNGRGFVLPNSTSVASGGGSSSWSNSTPGAADLTLTVKRADYGPYNNQGGAGRLRALRTVDIFPGHPGVVINNTIEPGLTNTITSSDLLPQLIAHNAPGVGQNAINAAPLPYVHTYGLQEPLAVFSGQTVQQSLMETATAPATEHPQLRFWARHNGATAPLRVIISTEHQATTGTTAIISTDAFESYPEIADGWRQVDIEVDPALLIGNDGTEVGPAAPRWASDTSPYRSWEILGAKVVDALIGGPIDPANATQTGIGTYGDNVAEGGVTGAFPSTNDIDVAVAWGQEMPDTTGVVLTELVQDLVVVDGECPVPVASIPDGLTYLSLSWDAIDAGYAFVGFGHYLVQRQDDTMGADEWETVATAVHPLAATFDDYEARIGVATRYRVRYVHANGMTGAWSDTVTATIAAPGVTGTNPLCGVLTFTSNADPSANLAYAQAFTGDPAEEFTFPEADTRALQRMYGRDYQVAFRPLERGGAAFTRRLLVNAATVTPETLYKGFTGLRDLAWADVPYIAVRSSRGDRWLANVNVPSGTIRNRKKQYVAEVVITEVSGTPYAVSPTYCEGMTAAGTLPGTAYEPRYAATPAGDRLDSNDMSLRINMRLDLFQRFPIVSRYDPIAVTNDDGWILELQDNKTVQFLNVAAAQLARFDSAAIPYGPGDEFWLRFDYDSGGATSTGAYFTSPDGVTWNPLATTMVDNDPLAQSATAAPYPLVVGAIADGTSDWVASVPTGGAGGWNGVIKRMIMLGDGGVVLADADFANEDPAAREFVDSVDNTWSVSGGICTLTGGA
jgi:hypothetical protein